MLRSVAPIILASGPSLSIVSVVRVEFGARASQTSSRKAAHGLRQPYRPLMPPSRATAAASVRDGVVRLRASTRARPVPLAVSRIQRHALLRGLDQVEPPIAPRSSALNPPTSPIASVHPSNSSGWLSTSQCAPYLPPASSSAGTRAPRHAPAGALPAAAAA